MAERLGGTFQCEDSAEVESHGLRLRTGRRLRQSSYMAVVGTLLMGVPQLTEAILRIRRVFTRSLTDEITRTFGLVSRW